MSCRHCEPLCKAVLTVQGESYACWEPEGHAGMHRALNSPVEWNTVEAGPVKVELPPVCVQGFDRMFKRIGEELG